MAKVFTNDENYENIAEAIRYMNGENTTYTPEEMAGAIRSIPAGATIPDGSITTEKLADEAVTNAKMAADAVDTPNIVNGAITSDKIGAFAVTNGKIDGGAVGTAQLATNAVTTAKIKDKAVNVNKLDNILQNLLDQLYDMLQWYTDTHVMSRVLVEDTVTSLSTLNTWTGTDGVYFFTLSGGAAGQLGVDANTAAKMEYIGDYQVISFAVYNKKYYRLIESFAPSFVAGAWTLAT